MINLIGKIVMAQATTAERLSGVPKSAELVWDTDLKALFSGDDVTVGGVRVTGDFTDVNDAIAKVAADLSKEVTDRTAADTQLDTKIDQSVTVINTTITQRDTESKQRDTQLQDNINGLTNHVNNEVSDIYTAISGVNDAISNTNRDLLDTKNELQSNIDAESAARNSRDVELTTIVNKEIADRKAADLVFTNDIAAANDAIGQEAEERDSAVSSLQTQINELTISSGATVAQERADRIAADTVLQTNINTVSADVDAETQARIAADGVLQANITAEATARTNADNLLRDAITQEVTDRTAAIATVNGRISSEITALDNKISANAADIVTLQADLIIEMNNRQDGDDDMRNRVDREVAALTTAIDAVADSVEAEKEARELADTGINNVIAADKVANAARFSNIDGTLTNHGELIEDNASAIASEATTREQDVAASNARILTLEGLVPTKANIADLKTVAFTGSYDDLINKPVIDPQVPADWNATTGPARILNKPTTIAGYGITDAINVNRIGVANGVAGLDENGKVVVSQLPAIAISQIFVVDSEEAQLALDAQEGDTCNRTDIPAVYIHNSGNTGTMSDWTFLVLPTSPNVVSVNGKTGVVIITKADVGLSNVDNTSDVNKPISTATLNALNAKANNNFVVSELDAIHTELDTKFDRNGEPTVNLTQAGVAATYSPTGFSAQTATSSYDVQYPQIADQRITVTMPAVSGTLVTDTTETALQVRRQGAWVPLVIPVTSVAGKTGAVTLNKSDVGLANVDNTSDANKPISTATQTALNGKINVYGSTPAASVLAAPATADGIPTFRALAATDIPTLTQYALSARTITVGAGLTGGGDLTANRSIALNAASIASLAKADTALQPAAIGTTVQAFSANLVSWSAIAPTAKANSGDIKASTLTTATSSILGRVASGVGAVQELTLGTGLRFNGTTIETVNNGTVTSVGITPSGAGISVSNSPITASGNIGITLSANLQSWSGIDPASKANTTALSDYLPLVGGTVQGNLAVSGQITTPTFVLAANSDNAYRFRMVGDANFAYIQSGRPTGNATPNTGGKLRFTGWLGTTADEIRVDAVSFNRSGNEIVDVRGAVFTGEVVAPLAVVDTATNVTLSSSHTNRILRKTGTSAVIATIPSALGRDGDVITFTNSASGNITVSAGSGVTLYSAGTSVSTYVLNPFRSVTVLRISNNVWSIN